jgi:CDP-glycerol glycerophosphotransferase (TagB/SpsB family)
VRPHPYSFIYEADFIEKLKSELSPFENIKFDCEIDNLKSLAKADILISDVSGVRFDFAFAFNRPVISLETDSGDIAADYDYADLSSYWDIDVSARIGKFIKKADIDKIAEIVKESLGNKENAFFAGQEALANIGNSAKVMAGQIENMLNTLNEQGE